MKALQRIHMLRKLNLGYNSITDEGASDIANAILCNTNLQEIDINGNTFDARSVNIIMEAYHSLK